MDRTHGAFDHDLRLMYVWIEDPILFRRAPRPPNTVLVSNIAAKHLGLAADVTLSHEATPPGRKNCRQTLESVAWVDARPETVCGALRLQGEVQGVARRDAGGLEETEVCLDRVLIRRPRSVQLRAERRHVLDFLYRAVRTQKGD